MLSGTECASLAGAIRKKLFGMTPEFDVIVTTNTVHVGYLCGYRSILMDADRYYRSAVVATRDGVLLVTGGSDAAAALEVTGDPARIFRYGEFFVSSHEPGTYYEAMPPAAATFEAAVGAALKAVLKPSHRIGIDAPDRTGFAAIEAHLAGHIAENATSAIVKARAVKLPGEVEVLRLAARVSEAGTQKAIAAARPGMSELELATIISAEIIANGGIPRFIVVTAGLRSALVDAYASPHRLEAGALLRIDIGCTFNGYWADNARTVVMGEPSALQRSRYDAILAGELAQLAALRPGTTAGELFRIGVEATREAGFPTFNRNHCGHGIGVVAHEYPSLNAAHEHVAIEAGMVLCVETPYYEMGWGGMMVEDTVLVTASGYEPLTVADRSLRVI